MLQSAVTYARSLVLALLVVFLAACAGPGARRDAPAEISDPAGEAVAPTGPGGSRADPGQAAPVPAGPVPAGPATTAEPVDGAYSGLLAAAVQARSGGNSMQAIALLERAQRIDPGNARLYLELARTHFDAGNAAQGRATAERGLLYCRPTECAALRELID